MVDERIEHHDRRSVVECAAAVKFAPSFRRELPDRLLGGSRGFHRVRAASGALPANNVDSGGSFPDLVPRRGDPMILRSAVIRKFRSIDDSGTVRFEPDATVLIGKNESGKTAFLEALARVNPVAGNGQAGFDELRDYPRRLRARERAAIADTVPVTATFELTDDDLDAVEERFGPGVLAGRELRVERTYAGRRRLAFHQGEGGPELLAELAAMLGARLPRFLYFDGWSLLPGRVSLQRLQATAEAELEPGERTALALLRLAGVAPAELTEHDYELRRAALETAANSIGEEVFRYWSQSRELTVELDVDDRQEPGARGAPPFLNVRIRNQRHRVTTGFGERSSGFVWFFSFLAAFAELRDAKDVILLLDEPGLGLHAAGQADLLRFVEEQLASGHQVVYTTHSPFMVDPARPGRVRTVEDVEDQGTKVRDGAHGAGRETVVPLQAALAFRLAAGLADEPRTLLVDGPADLVYLEVMGAYLRDAGRHGLDPVWRVVPTGGLDGIPALAALLGAPLRAAVLLGVGAGSPLVLGMVQQGLVLPERLLPLTELLGQAEAGVEDLFDEAFYLHLLAEAGIASLRREQLPGPGPVVRRVEAAVGRPLDRYPPACHLLYHQQQLLPVMGRETLHRFARLFGLLAEL
jgi:predicted ATPase